MTKIQNLGQNWFAALNGERGSETLTIVDAKTGYRDTISNKSVETLRQIFATVGKARGSK